MKKPLEEHIDFYYNAQGYVVLTEKYHRERGYCCGNGCLHCPFDYENVPDDKKSRLRAARKAQKGA
ncbi:MAG: DUF5522 domain-containing protein [Chitinophaga sp.]|jgi:hypothetical protein